MILFFCFACAWSVVARGRVSNAVFPPLRSRSLAVRSASRFRACAGTVQDTSVHSCLELQQDVRAKMAVLAAMDDKLTRRMGQFGGWAARMAPWPECAARWSGVPGV